MADKPVAKASFRVAPFFNSVATVDNTVFAVLASKAIPSASNAAVRPSLEAIDKASAPDSNFLITIAALILVTNPVSAPDIAL